MKPDPLKTPKTTVLSRPLALWRKLRSHWWGRLGTETLVVLVVLWGVTLWQSRNLVSAGALAPDFELRTLDGTVDSLSNHRGEKVVLVFWAPWCTVCGLETGDLSNLNEDPDITVLSVVLSFEDPDSINTFVEKNEVRYAVLIGTSKISELYNVGAFPTLYLIDEEGRIQSSLVGYTTEYGIRARIGEWW